MMIRVAITVVLGLAVAAGAAAQERDAPLAGTKKELQELRERQKASTGPDMKDGLRSAAPMPEFSPMPGGSEALAPRPTPQSLEKERRQREKARQNWLLNGMNRLEKESKDSGKRAVDPTDSAEGDDTVDSTGRIDTSDPAYLLKLYDRQKQAAENKAAAASADKPVRAADPLAPFLQGWLADSPVREQALAGASRQPAASPVGVAASNPAGPSSVAHGPAALLREQRPAAAPSNPYLADPAQPAPGPLLLLRPAELPSAPLPTPLAPAGGPARSESLAAPLPEPAPAPRRVAPPPPADDKKYFPQLKKF